MATSVTFNGTTYSVPAAGEVAWASLSNFLIDVANNAQIKSKQISAIRTATTTPVTGASTDFCIVTDMASASAVAVTLPTGVNGQMICIVDGRGDAATNNVTISGAGGQTVNEAASYVINRNNGAALFQWSTTQNTWVVIAEYSNVQGHISASTSVHGVTGSVVGTSDSQTLTNKTINGSSNTITNVSLTAAVTGTLPVGNGGTGQTTANAALNALLPTQSGNSGKVLSTDATNTSWITVATDPTTTRGDLIRRGASALERFAAVTDNRVVRGDGTDVVLGQIDDTGFFTTGAIVGASAPGIMPSDLTGLSNEAATRMGLKSYSHGTTYNGGNAPTITLVSGGGSLSSVTRSYFIPYQMMDGTWRLKFSVMLTLSATARTSVAFAVNSVTMPGPQPLSATIQNGGGLLDVYNGVTDSNNFTVYGPSQTTQEYNWFGDIALSAKPNWAY